jgi:hypothetical protein
MNHNALHMEPVPTDLVLQSMPTTSAFQWKAVQHVPLPSTFFKDDCSKSVVTLVYGFTEYNTGRSPTAEEYAFLHSEIKLLRAVDCTEIKDDILSIKSKTLNVHTNTISVQFRINSVSRNYRSPFVLHISPAHTSTSIPFMSFNTNPIDVRSKTPMAHLGHGRTKKRKRTCTKNPVWLLPWSKSAWSLIQALEWSTVDGYKIVNGSVDNNAPIRRCPHCFGFAEQGHRPKCQLVYILKAFKHQDESE